MAGGGGRDAGRGGSGAGGGVGAAGGARTHGSKACSIGGGEARDEGFVWGSEPSNCGPGFEGNVPAGMEGQDRRGWSPGLFAEVLPVNGQQGGVGVGSWEVGHGAYLEAAYREAGAVDLTRAGTLQATTPPSAAFMPAAAGAHPVGCRAAASASPLNAAAAALPGVSVQGAAQLWRRSGQQQGEKAEQKQGVKAEQQQQQRVRGVSHVWLRGERVQCVQRRVSLS